jgi:hypothetical protein
LWERLNFKGDETRLLWGLAGLRLARPVNIKQFSSSLLTPQLGGERVVIEVFVNGCFLSHRTIFSKKQSRARQRTGAEFRKSLRLMVAAQLRLASARGPKALGSSYAGVRRRTRD